MDTDDVLNDPNSSAQARYRGCLSALMDGDRDAADEACRGWREDTSLRADWHAYHVIGEVLRSEDAHCDASRDARFLARLRSRLADGPVVLAPARPKLRSRRRWMAPAAAAAGFVAVAGVMVATRLADTDGGARTAPLVASRDAAPKPALAAAPLQAGQAASALTAVPSGEHQTLIRSAELDRYLAAHRQYAGASPLAAPGGAVRGVATVVAPGR